jgi:hypothetical protein
MLLVSIIVPNVIISMENPIANIHSISIIESNNILSTVLPYLFFAYVLISSILFVRLLNAVVQIVKRIYNNQQIKHNNGTTLVLLAENILPHTFLNYIFINKEDYFSNTITNELYTHEFTHANQKHTFDVLLAEIFQVIFWFNPLSFFITKAIKLNHEFIADETVINTFNNRFQYQNMLLNVTTLQPSMRLTSNVNYALTKQRFLMMGKNTSSKIKNITKIAVIPLLVIMFFLFADITQSSKHSENKEHHSTSEHTS